MASSLRMPVKEPPANSDLIYKKQENPVELR